MSNVANRLIWYRGELRILAERGDGNLHPGVMTIDVEKDGLRYIFRIEALDGQSHPHGVDVPVRFAMVDGPTIENGDLLSLWLGSRKFGELVVTDNSEASS